MTYFRDPVTGQVRRDLGWASEAYWFNRDPWARLLCFVVLLPVMVGEELGQ